MVQAKVLHRPAIWFLTLGILGIAWAGSFWALHADGNVPCSSCQEAKELTGGPGLALLGTIAYSCLLALGLFLGPSRLFLLGTVLAAGAHVVLLTLLLRGGIFCPPCLVAGGAAITAMVLYLRFRPANPIHVGIWLSVAIVMTSIFLRRGVPGDTKRVSTFLASSPSALSKPRLARTPGTVQVLAFVRDGCHYCDELKDDVFPVIKEEFGGQVSIETKPAPDGIPTPTIVIDGARRTVFPGLPPLSRLREAILDAQEDRP